MGKKSRKLVPSVLPSRLHPHVLNILGMQMKSRLHMQSSHVPLWHTTWLINKQIKLINKQITTWLINKQIKLINKQICLLISHVDVAHLCKMCK